MTTNNNTSATVSVESTNNKKENTMNTIANLSIRNTIVRNQPIINNADMKIKFNNSSLYVAFSEEALGKAAGQSTITAWNPEGFATSNSIFRGSFSAMIHVMKDYEVIGSGYILKDREIIMGRAVKNYGYVLGAVADMLFKGIKFTDEKIENQVYQVSFNGREFFASLVPYIKATKDEGETAKKFRATLRMFDGAQALFSAYATGTRLMLAWSAKKDYSAFAAYIKDMHEAFVEGDEDRVAEMSARSIAKEQIWDATGSAMRKIAKGETLEVNVLQLQAGGTIEVNENLVGKTVRVWKGNLDICDLVLTEQNLVPAAVAINGKGRKISFLN